MFLFYLFSLAIGKIIKIIIIITKTKTTKTKTSIAEFILLKYIKSNQIHKNNNNHYQKLLEI